MEEQDFGQYDQIDLTPTLEASMFYIEAPETLIDLVPSDQFFDRDVNFDAFSSDIFSNRVLDGTIMYIIENATSYEMEIEIDFLDVLGNVLDTETFSVPSAPTAKLRRDVSYGPAGENISIIKNTSSIRVRAVNLGNIGGTSVGQDPKIILKSSGKFRVQLK